MTLPADLEAMVEACADEEWQTLLDKDDRNSPADYPDMCLITRDELASAMRAAIAVIAARGGPDCAAVFVESADERRERRKREHPELCFRCNPEGATCVCAL